MLERQLDALESVGVEPVVIVVGFQHEQIRRVAQHRARFIVNERYEQTNSLYSFLLAVPSIGERDLYVINADVLFCPDLLRKMKEIGGNVVSYDSTSGREAEHMKVSFSNGSLRTMSKAMSFDRSDGENLGVVHLDHDGFLRTVAAARRLIEGGGDREWLAAAITLLAQEKPVRGFDVAGTPWIEIDFRSDLRRARTQVWPVLCRFGATWQTARTGDRHPDRDDLRLVSSPRHPDLVRGRER